VSYEDEIERWRAARLARLTAPGGWLSLTGLFWLHEGENTVGTDGSSDVVLPHGAPVAGRIDVQDARATAHFPPGSGVTANGREVTTLALRHDLDDEPTELALGSIGLRLLHRGGQLAVRVADRERPGRLPPPAIPHYPVDPRWRVEARFEAHDPERRMLLPSVVGPGQEYRIAGRLSFEVDAHRLELEAYRELDEEDLFIVFGDLTNRDETYGGGRYLYAKTPTDSEPAILDFNRAYNPACVFSPFVTCVLAQPDNRLPVRIEAGERRYVPT
jgi:uncharacterized protein (DUF1684 family)